VAIDVVEFKFVEANCEFTPPDAKPVPTSPAPPTTTKAPTTSVPTTIEPTEPPDCKFSMINTSIVVQNVRIKYFLQMALFNYVHLYLPTPISGTIKCNFDADWCNFGVSATGDGNSQAGFKWARKTSQQITNNNLEGPGQG
jgi:hypothetical protein